MNQSALDLFKAKFTDGIIASGTSLGDEWAQVKGAQIAEMAAFLKNDPALDMKLLADITAVDFLHYDPEKPRDLEDPERYEVVYQFGSVTKKHRLRLKIKVGGTKMSLPTLSFVYRTANWWERLIFDFYGVKFEGHPHLRRILTYDEFVGHPLRKDYPVHQRQPLTLERHVKDLVRGPGPGASTLHAPFSQRPGARPNTKSDAYD